jgi:hypothetical protein
MSTPNERIAAQTFSGAAKVGYLHKHKLDERKPECILKNSLS